MLLARTDCDCGHGWVIPCHSNGPSFDVWLTCACVRIHPGCRFPGAATSPSRLWDMLEQGRSAQSKVPADRFNINAFYHENVKRPGSMPVDGGYFIDEDVRGFDTSFFGIRPVEARSIDPQHRNVLEVAYECIESSGLNLDDVAGSKTGVFMANFTNDFADVHLRDSEYPPDYKWVGLTNTLMSNRVSYVFDLKGPRYVVAAIVLRNILIRW